MTGRAQSPTSTVDSPGGSPSHPGQRKWLISTFVVAALIYGVPSVLALLAYMQPAFDLGIYDQTLWLIAHGENLNTVAGIHLFGAHFSPILFLLSPIAFIPGGAVPELVLQAIVIGSGVLPAWKLGRALGHDPRWFAVVYAIHPAIIGGSWWGWRPWNIAVPLFMWACYFIVQKPTTFRIVTSGVVLLLFREDLAAWVGYLVLVLFLAAKIKLTEVIRSGVLLGAATALVVLVVLPELSPVDDYFFSGQLQSGLPGPIRGVSSVATRLVFWLLPLAILPTRLNWKLMIPLVIPVTGLLLRGGTSLTTFYHYDMMFVPILLVIAGLSVAVEYRPLRLIAASLLTLLIIGVLRPVPPHLGVNPWSYTPEVAQAFSQIHADLESVEGIESLSLTGPTLLLPHFTERSNVFLYPYPTDVYRDPDGRESNPSLHMDCPPPNLLVALPESLTPAWETTIEDVGYSRIATTGRFAIWIADHPQPEEPCSAAYVTPSGS